MIIANVHKAKTDLSKLLFAVENGEEVFIAKSGDPLYKVIKAKPEQKRSSRGVLKGKVLLNDEHFDDEDPEINKLFYGE